MFDEYSNGWIKLWRKIRDHEFYKERRIFSRYEAWIDMLQWANHQDNSFLIGNELIKCERGSFVTSELKLMNHWNWSKEKTRRFLSVCEACEMIERKADRKKTTISIINYNGYQSQETTEKPLSDHRETTERPRRDHERDTTKEVKNVRMKRMKENKNIYGEFKNVLLLEEEYKKLTIQFGESGIKERIENLSSYIASKGKKYSSHYATILSWERRKNGTGEHNIGKGDKASCRKYDGIGTTIETGS